jgi:hypothetical protein
VLAMAFKPIDSAQGRWRAINGPHPLVLVHAGATFRKGVLTRTPPLEDQVAA